MRFYPFFIPQHSNTLYTLYSVVTSTMSEHDGVSHSDSPFIFTLIKVYIYGHMVPPKAQRKITKKIKGDCSTANVVRSNF